MSFHKDETGASLHIGPTIQKNGSGTSARRKINFVEGTNITITVADDGGGDKTDVTVNSTASSTAFLVRKQTTGGGTTFGDSTLISVPVLAIGRVTIPASTTQTVTINIGGSPATNIYSVVFITKGNFSNLVYLEDVAGNVLPKVGSTITINNNDTVSHDVYIQAIVD